MVCSGTSVKWLAWPHWGISLPAQSHPKCCSIAGGLAFRVLYSIGGCCSGSCEFWQKIEHLVKRKNWKRFGYCLIIILQVKIIKRKTVNEWLTQFRVYLKFIAENLLMTPEEIVLFPLLLCCSTAIYTWRRNSVLFALLTHFGFPSQPLRQETSLPNERCTAISC